MRERSSGSLINTHELSAIQGRVPEWLKGTGCKPVSYAYHGSNPCAPTIIACVAQSVERILGKDEVSGSNPLTGSIFGGVAQLVRAHGSYPWRHWFKSSHRYHSYYSASRMGRVVMFVSFARMRTLKEGKHGKGKVRARQGSC